MFLDAAETARQAILEDRGQLGAYLTLARALKATGSDQPAHFALQSALMLLRTDPHQSSLEAHLDILPVVSLINETNTRSACLAAIVANSPSLLRTPDALSRLCDALLSAGLPEGVMPLVDPGNPKNLELETYKLEAAYRLGAQPNPHLIRTVVEHVGPADRGALHAWLRTLSQNATFSDQTRRFLLDAISSALSRWHDEIRQEMLAKAKVSARSKVSSFGLGCSIALLLYVAVAWVGIHIGINPEGFAVPVFLVLAGTVGTCVAMLRSRRKLSQVEAAEFGQLAESMRKTWAEVGVDLRVDQPRSPSSSPPPSGPSSSPPPPRPPQSPSPSQDSRKNAGLVLVVLALVLVSGSVIWWRQTSKGSSNPGTSETGTLLPSSALPPKLQVSRVETSGSSSSGQSSASIKGTWQGMMTQKGYPPFPIVMQLDEFANGRKVGSYEHPTLRCGGYLVGLDVKDGTYLLSGHIEYGRERCLDGTNQLTLNADASLTRVWIRPGGRNGDAVGTLRKIEAGSGR
jgi:hypothetical protein